MCPRAQLLDAPQGLDENGWTAAVGGFGPIDHIFWIAPDAPAAAHDDAMSSLQEQGVIALFRLTRGLLACGYATRDLGWTVLTFGAQRVLRADDVAPVHAAVHGFVGSMAKEFPLWASA